jgi:hypothetical protein
MPFSAQMGKEKSKARGAEPLQQQLLKRISRMRAGLVTW